MLELVPILKADADAFIRQHHCHHLPTVGWKFGVGVSDGDRVVGLVVVGRPVGTSLLAGGWRPLYQSSGGTWSRPSRLTVDRHPLGQKMLWEAV